jgi:putative tricarboxylic transport membrane protein
MLERVVSLAVLAAAGGYLTQALALPYGNAARPGAGFFPTLVALFACAVAVVMTAQSFRTATAVGERSALAPDLAASRGRVVSTVVVLIAFCLLLPWVGYPVVAFGFVAVLLRRLGSGWRAALVAAAVSAAGSHFVFAVVLDVPLPRGPW